MPLYEYRCPHCGSEFERLASYTQADMIACPVCEHLPAQRRISRVAARSRDGGASDAGWSSGSACGPSGSFGGG
jgi:putative FmdB family regulatory protein